MFPVFRSRFIQESAWLSEALGQQQVVPGKEDRTEPLVKMAGCGPAAVRGPAGLLRPLMLDLNTLPREDGPPSESVLKRQKFAVFEKHCSQVAEGLYVSGEAVARDRAVLAQHSISHVVNCVGALYPEFFKNDGVQYKTLWLQDHPQEDIVCVLYDTFDFIEAARRGGSNNSGASAPNYQQQRYSGRVPPLQLQQSQRPQQQLRLMAGAAGDAAAGGSSRGGGRVLVHCSQGVSRSTTIAIAYLMWKTGRSYDEVYQTVRALRGVTSPNVGFMCQLINWAKRRQRPPSRVRLYRIAPHCPDAPTYLVPKALSPKPGCSYPDWTLLDPRGCFVAHLPTKVYVWKGQDCMSIMLDAGIKAAAGLSRYEGAPQAQVVRQGEEPDDLLNALSPSSSNSGSSTRHYSSNMGSAVAVEPSLAAVAAADRNGCPADSHAEAGSSSKQLDCDDMDMSAAPSAPGTRPGSAHQQQQQQPGAPFLHQGQPLGQLANGVGPPEGLAAAGDSCGNNSSSRSLQPRMAACDNVAAGCSSSGGCSGSGDCRGPPLSSSQHAAGCSAGAEDVGSAAAAAARVLLRAVQLGPEGSTGALPQVQDYNQDFNLLYAALHKAGYSEGGHLSTPRSPVAAAARGWEEPGSTASPRAESPASVEGRNRKYRRSDSEGRSVVSSCRQPGRLSASSSSQTAWADGGAAGTAAAGASVAEAEGGVGDAVSSASTAAAGINGHADWPAAAHQALNLRMSVDENMAQL